MGKRLSSAAFSFDDIRHEFALPTDYPDAAVTEAKNAVDRFADAREDRTDIPFVTIDPPASMDLHHDQRCICCASSQPRCPRKASRAGQSLVLVPVRRSGGLREQAAR
ncbi:hypothetical protein [Smaragdicoccus niigatensis]|uniref:hypothetical protein n=1 Tax=Smaragdicoccus niigatensis TaxID=359359 RepID=UPI0003721F0B|nr:hypothetical protein [Smaragdicoccus niigatensis]